MLFFTVTELSLHMQAVRVNPGISHNRLGNLSTAFWADPPMRARSRQISTHNSGSA